MGRLMNPCIDHCYQRFGKKYTEECDTQCEFARIAKENKELIEVLAKIAVAQNEASGHSCDLTDALDLIHTHLKEVGLFDGTKRDDSLS